MNALAIAMVKNEADIIEASIRHNLGFVDLMVVIDNDSSDGTRQILEALRQEGLPLLIIDDPVFGHFQSEKITRAYRMVAPVFNPDIVYLLDADEFLRAPSRAALEGVLGALPPGGSALLPWMTYVPRAEVDPAQLLADPLGAVTERRRREEPVYYKAVVRRDPADDQRLVVEQGNHAVRRADGVAVPQVRIDGAAVAHLPVRSVAQLSAKVINGWQACRVRNRTRNVPGEAYQWQQLHDRIVGGEDLSAANLVETALNYAQQPRPGRHPDTDLVRDPVAAGYGPLRHLALGRHSALAKVALGLSAMTEPQPALKAAPGQALDLAPALDLCTNLGAKTAIVMAGPGWADALATVRPSLVQHVPVADEPDMPVDLLFAPGLPAGLIEEVSAAASPQAIGRIAFWPARPRGAGELEGELLRWYQCGWEPDMMRTMSFRALSSYGDARRGALVLGPVDPARETRAAAVRGVLCALDTAPTDWTDPPAMAIVHPLQPLALGEAPAPSPATGTATAAPVAARPAPPKPRSVLICGSGRSGTSCLAGMFGPDTHRHATDLYAPSPSNPKGFFENRQINDLNEAILMHSAVSHLGTDGTRALLQGFTPGQLWLARFPDAMPARWNDGHRGGIAGALAKSPFCLKDPRFSLTAPAWLEQVPEAAVLCIHRAPAITAESVLKECRSSPYLRDFRISVSDAFAVWRQMYRRVIELYRDGADVIFLRYQDLFDAERLGRLEAALHTPLRRQFAEGSLNRTQASLTPPAECQALHELLERLAERTFDGDRAGNVRLIEQFLAAWPVRGGTAATAMQDMTETATA
ncbi:glycosyltransferase family 2 protein [Ideonella sp.]|uniref:glycosyltransferase family 2 protein n=1 Tax=Ideonella sp. TaxID=1929293 RepID=UPI002B49358D|nr:glycosyltransferase family 2 protein [Ideonella sp.]HJV70836.1 glycosyltransferase family 2 protein [Ideonella sp.]